MCNMSSVVQHVLCHTCTVLACVSVGSHPFPAAVQWASVSADEDDSLGVLGGDASSSLPCSPPPPFIPVPSSIETDSRAILEMFATLDWAEESSAPPDPHPRSILDPPGVREPGRVLQIHEKLSSPSRKLPLHEKLRRHNERLARAEVQRQALIATKTEKLKELFRRIEEVSADKERLLEEKRVLLDRKMDRAEEKRRQHLQGIVDKAHDEDNKGREIAFINGLEAQNKLHDLLQQHQSHSCRLANIAEERSRRQEEKAAKEAATQERRRVLEAERQARLLALCARRRERCERIDRQQAERREELQEQAREKARDRQERLTALMQAQQAKECELVRRIRQKQQESARRHEENIEQIRRRAFESSILRCSRGCDDAPKIGRYERKKLCTLCHCLLSSEVYLLSHLRGARHQDALRELHAAPLVSSEDTATYNLRHIVDAPDNVEDPQLTRNKERQKALKKRCRKIRTRMATRGRDYDSCYRPPLAQPSAAMARRIGRALQSISRLQAGQGSGPWSAAEVAALDKALLELLRILDKRDKADQEAFCALNGYEKITDLLGSLMGSDDGEKRGGVAEGPKTGRKKDSKKSLIIDTEDKENPVNTHVAQINSNNKNKSRNLSNSKTTKHQRLSPTYAISDLNDDDLNNVNLLHSSDTLNGTSSDTVQSPSAACVIPSKSLGLCSRVLHASLAGHANNARHMLYSNLVSVLLDWLMNRLRVMTLETVTGGGGGGGGGCSPVVPAVIADPTVTYTLQVLAEVLSVVSEADLVSNSSSPTTSSSNTDQNKNRTDATWLRLQDMVSCVVCVGAADRLSWYLSHVQGPAPLEAEQGVSDLILAVMCLLSAMANTLMMGRGSNCREDPTQLLNTLQVTEACGVVSLLYGLLLHDGGRSSYLTSSSATSGAPGSLPSTSVSPTPTLTSSCCNTTSLTPALTSSPVHHLQQQGGSTSSTSTGGADYNRGSDGNGGGQPPQLQPAIEAITVAATTLLHNLAVLDLGVFQGVLGSEGISLELRHVASFLLWYCSYWPSEAILHNVIAIVGFLTVSNRENQSVVQSGETPTVLQQLCALPWPYFSEPRLTALLFPTLLACCAGNPYNKAVLEAEMSALVLEDYLADEGAAASSPLMKLLRHPAAVQS